MDSGHGALGVNCLDHLAEASRNAQTHEEQAESQVGATARAPACPVLGLVGSRLDTHETEGDPCASDGRP